eukprot:772399-Pleurochrysis_carterae.AAC.1
MMPYMTGMYGNPHSKTHAYGWETNEAVEKARDQASCARTRECVHAAHAHAPTRTHAHACVRRRTRTRTRPCAHAHAHASGLCTRTRKARVHKLVRVRAQRVRRHARAHALTHPKVRSRIHIRTHALTDRSVRTQTHPHAQVRFAPSASDPSRFPWLLPVALFVLPQRARSSRACVSSVLYSPRHCS